MRADGSDSDSSTFSLFISSIVSRSGVSDWLLDSGATYHVCPTKE